MIYGYLKIKEPCMICMPYTFTITKFKKTNYVIVNLMTVFVLNGYKSLLQGARVYKVMIEELLGKGMKSATNVCMFGIFC
ncbi:hypothetical protein Hdeb2414_s0026g00679611 [Helianthus debilis subsp. tardiflorus]